MGERCCQHEALGQPSKLSRYSADNICASCREKERDAQVGVTENVGPSGEVVGQSKDAPLEANGYQAPSYGNIAEPSKPPGLCLGEVVMSVRIYEREGWSPEEWRRLCERHGEDPNWKVVYLWEGVEPGETFPPDKTTACGKPGMAISGYTLVCKKCWSGIQAGGPPRVCEPWDDDPTLPEERYGWLLRAARVLFEAG
jgi:hypothetical protein